MPTTPADPLHTLYGALAPQQSAPPTPVRRLPADERRAYMRAAKRRSRERQRAASDGIPEQEQRLQIVDTNPAQIVDKHL
ncbi:hypothetical protein ACP4J4_02735 [Aureimonas ureilytica]|uniref:hypothetical protein n=1 Tax=Aureimonas ureilytica TaxID=401562 RepID=UPI003CF4EFD6